MYNTDEAYEQTYYYEKILSNETYSKGCFACNFPPDGSFSRYGSYLRSPVIIHNGNSHIDSKLIDNSVIDNSIDSSHIDNTNKDTTNTTHTTTSSTPLL